MRRLLFLIAFISVVFADDKAFNAADYKARDISAIRLNEPLRIDGRLTEPIYQTPSNQTFIQLDPDNGEPATEETEVWVAYDDGALYIGARMWDDQPDSIVALMGRRDANFNTDFFLALIDAYHDKRSGFFFGINPSGAIQDGTFYNDSWSDDSWDGVWDGKTAIDENGWTAEMRIPFSQLRFNQQKEYVWGILLARIIQRRNETDLFTYIERGESGVVSHAATLRGIEDIQPPERREFTPYVTSGYSSLPSEKDNPFLKGRDTNLKLGTDLKMGIGSNITVDATINPDFGQVEVDPSVINLSAYETYYQEKRPFFVEGASIFSFGTHGPTSRWGFNSYEPDFFYSRRIGRPPQCEVDTEGWVDMPTASSILGAAKISGKLNGDWSLGGLSALTNREFAQINEEGNVRSQEVEPLTSYNLVRTQKEFNDGRQGLGVLGTYVYRHFDDPALRDVLADNALVFGIDGWTFIGPEKEWAIGGWGGFSRVAGAENRMIDLQHSSIHYFQRPDAEHVAVDSAMTAMMGYASRFTLNRETGHLILNAALGLVSPGFESNDMGLHFGTDRINKHLGIGYNWYDPGKVFRRAQLITAYMSNHNFGGAKINEMVFLFGYAQLLNYWGFEAITGWGPRTLSDTHLRGGPMVVSMAGWFVDFNINTDNRKNIVANIYSEINHREMGSWSYNVSGNLEIKMGTRLNLRIGPHYSTNRTIDQFIDIIEDDNATAMYGNRYVMAQIDQKTISADLRIDYTFTPRLSLQAYFQPFIAVGSYSHFKEFKRPKSYDFLEYGQEGSTIDRDDESGEYIIDPTGGDDSNVFYIEYPDFNFKALVGTAVLRWEFTPGSTLYLVWTRNGYDERNPGDFQFGRDLSDLFGATADNIFAIKVAYWIGR
ncbi:MAG: DUF5916 domain-containing protein [Candidatus Neomarinimicrobiota bacterium]